MKLRKSQRLVLPAGSVDLDKLKKSTPRFARAYYSVFSLEKERAEGTHDRRGAYRTTTSDWVFFGFLVWFISVI